MLLLRTRQKEARQCSPQSVKVVPDHVLMLEAPYAASLLHFRHSTTKMSEKGNVVLDTGMGQITVELYWNEAPKTCKNFYELAKRGYYTGTIFHRIIPNFMIQGGDPTGTGRGGTSIYGGKFEDEITRALRFTGAGILAMANSGPNTNGSQFFITLAPTPHLDGKHTIFGRILSGMRVVERLGAVRTDAQDRPLEEIKILKSRVVEPEDDEENGTEVAETS